MEIKSRKNRKRRRKCRCCRELYEADPCHLKDQRFCLKPECRKASKVASHRRWRRGEVGRSYFKGNAHVVRVQEWRKAHPGYWKKNARSAPTALQDTQKSEVADIQKDRGELNEIALQDMQFMQPALIVGLIASLTGSALQDTLVETSRRYVLLGQNILGKTSGTNPKGVSRDGEQTSSMSGTITSSTASVQLGGSAPGPQ